MIEYQSFREKGSTVFFLRPFLPLESLLFLEYRVSPLSSLSLFVEGDAHFPTAMFAGLYVNRWRDGTGERVVEGRDDFNLRESLGALISVG